MSDNVGPKNRPPEPAIALLRPDNFTPPTRTPWGGHRLTEVLKSALLPDAAGQAVGESWELSLGPEFPSALLDGTALNDVVGADPTAWLGPAPDPARLLVKLIDTAAPLSVQIHPSDDYPDLGPGQGGKPEAWYVVHAEPGAGLYLGLTDEATPLSMREAIDTQADVSTLLHFVEVSPGDFFVIDAGTPHAIGAGLTLVEPQRVVANKRGVTYRYWDWNRRYDAQGNRDDNGSPRPLHVDDALAVTDWSRPRQAALIDTIGARNPWPDVDGPVALSTLAGPGGSVASDVFRIARLSGTGTIDIPRAQLLTGLTVIAGEVTVVASATETIVRQGQSAAIAACVDVRLRAQGAHALLCAVT